MSGSFVAPWTVACQAPLSLGFSSQEYWSRLPFPSQLKNGHELEQTPEWRTGKPGALQSLGSQRFGHDLVTEQQE